MTGAVVKPTATRRLCVLSKPFSPCCLVGLLSCVVRKIIQIKGPGTDKGECSCFVKVCTLLIFILHTSYSVHGAGASAYVNA